MEYEVGQKVETPLGVGEVKGVRNYQEPIYQIKFMGSNFKVLDFEENELKPYKTAHEKLIDMGYAYIVNYYDYILYHNEKTNEELYIYHNITYDANIDITLELSRILTQYLEELNEK